MARFIYADVLKVLQHFENLDIDSEETTPPAAYSVKHFGEARVVTHEYIVPFNNPGYYARAKLQVDIRASEGNVDIASEEFVRVRGASSRHWTYLRSPDASEKSIQKRCLAAIDEELREVKKRVFVP